MASVRTAPYGSWKSPISGEVLASGSSLPSELTLDGETPYWLELKPSEGGRYALYRKRRGRPPEEVVPKEFNVRTRVHEYGGGSYAARGPTVYFVNFGDQRLYRLDEGGSPKALTKEGLRYADFVVDERRERLVAVCEDHTGKGRYPVNSIASFSMDGTSSRTLVSGNDFYSSPSLDGEG